MAFFKFGSERQHDEPKKLWEAFFKSVLKYDWESALEKIGKLRELEPENAQVYIKLGDVLQRKGDKAGAVSAYHKAAAYMTDYINTQKALAIYKVILRLNPSDTIASEKTKALMKELGMDADDREQQTAAPKENPRQTRSLSEAFAKHPVFSAISPDDVSALPTRADKLTFGDGEIVIKEDEPGESIFVITRGSAKVNSTMLGKTYELATLQEWDFFGEVGFLSGLPRTATVIAEGPLEVLEIGRGLLEEIIEKNSGVLEKLVETSQSRTMSNVEKMKGGE